MLYSRSLLVIYFIYSSVYVNPKLLIYASPPTLDFLFIHILLLSVSWTLYWDWEYDNEQMQFAGY